MPLALPMHALPFPNDIASLPPLDLLRGIAETQTRDYLMLHSADTDDGQGYSVLGFDPLATFTINAAGIPTLERELPSSIPPLPPNAPLQALQMALETLTFAPPHPLIGWLGFLSYDIGRFLEKIPPNTSDQLHWPVTRFTLFKHYLVFDPSTPQVRGFTFAPENHPPIDWQSIARAARTPPHGTPAGILTDSQPRPDFEAKVARVKQYIAAGDIYQANLAQRWTLHTTAHPHDIFKTLCHLSPAPYAACMRFHHDNITRHVVSASPELFLAVTESNGIRKAVTRPIKGTRPRDLTNPDRDQALRLELLNSAKDRAELTMIVDLLRNDLGRVSDYGTIQVIEPRAIEQHPTLWHTVATIESRLRPDAGLADILAALCPGGSITGAPKIRAMQIIEELEGFRRGLYCGNIGVLGPAGRTIALNIAIRTILFQRDSAFIYAGAGIVADSDPAAECDETLHKAAAMMRAIGSLDFS